MLKMPHNTDASRVISDFRDELFHTIIGTKQTTRVLDFSRSGRSQGSSLQDFEKLARASVGAGGVHPSMTDGWIFATSNRKMAKGGRGHISNLVSYVCEYPFTTDLPTTFGVEPCGLESSPGHGFRVSPQTPLWNCAAVNRQAHRSSSWFASSGWGGRGIAVGRGVVVWTTSSWVWSTIWTCMMGNLKCK